MDGFINKAAARFAALARLAVDFAAPRVIIKKTGSLGKMEALIPEPRGYDATKRERVTSPARADLPKPSRRPVKSLMSRIVSGPLAANGLPMAPYAPARRFALHPFSGAELRWIRAHGQAREIARRLARLAPAGAIALVSLTPLMSFALSALIEWRLS